MPTSSARPFRRKIPSLPVRCAIGLAAYGLFGPIIRTLDKFGRAPAAIGAIAATRRKRGAAKHPFAGYTPTGHDVFVAAHVKSGTNWMLQIAHQLAFHGEADYDHIHSVVAWPDTAVMGPMRRYAIPLEDPSVWMASPEQKRVIKTHCDWDWLPYSPEAKYILVVRDPKDVFVSSYYFFIRDGPMRFTRFSVATWLEVFLSTGIAMWSTWPVSTAGYWAARHLPNVLIVSFADLKRDLPGIVRTVARFMEVDASDAVIARVSDKASFEYMKSIDDKFRSWNLVPFAPTAAPMMRKGQSAGSSELISAEEQERIDRHCRSELRRLGSDFPYELFCEVSPGLRPPPRSPAT